ASRRAARRSGANSDAADIGEAAFLAAPLDVSFEAGEEAPQLPVVAGLAAEHSAVEIEGIGDRKQAGAGGAVEQRIGARASPAVAAVEADIKAGPGPR